MKPVYDVNDCPTSYFPKIFLDFCALHIQHCA